MGRVPDHSLTLPDPKSGRPGSRLTHTTTSSPAPSTGVYRDTFPLFRYDVTRGQEPGWGVRTGTSQETPQSPRGQESGRDVRTRTSQETPESPCEPESGKIGTGLGSGDGSGCPGRGCRPGTQWRRKWWVFTVRSGKASLVGSCDTQTLLRESGRGRVSGGGRGPCRGRVV